MITLILPQILHALRQRVRHNASMRLKTLSRNLVFSSGQKTRDHRCQAIITFETNFYSTFKAMFCTFLLLAFSPFASFSASVLQPSQGTVNVAPDSLSTLTLADPFSLEPIESDSSLTIQSTSSSQSPNTTVLLTNSSLTGSEYDMPFEYPGLDDLLGAKTAELQCKGESFGFNLSKLSCTQAYSRLSTSNLVGTWGQRGGANYQVKLPYRLSSFDGFCALDVVHSKNSVSDFASPLEIKQAAAQIMDGCIRNGAPNTGGMIGNVGTLSTREYLLGENHQSCSSSRYTFK